MRKYLYLTLLVFSAIVSNAQVGIPFSITSTLQHYQPDISRSGNLLTIQPFPGGLTDTVSIPTAGTNALTLQGVDTTHLENRAFHTGTQAISTVTGLQAALDAKDAIITFNNGLTRTSNTVANDLITGKAGSQTIIGGTASGENLILKSTSNATLGLTEFDGTTGMIWDGTNKWLGIGITPTTELQIQKTSSTGIQALIRNQGTGSSSLYLRVAGGANTTDPYIILQSDSFYSMGIDQSDGSKFKIRNASALSTAACALVIEHFYQNVGIRVSAPTAALHLPASTAAINTAPLKFTSGTLLTTPEAGVMNYDGTNFYLSPSTTLKRIPLTNNATPSNGQIPIGNGTDYTVANITGSNTIGIANGSGTITVTADTSYLYTQSDANTALASYVKTLFTQTATQTVAATVTETTIIGSGVGSLSIPANTLIAGKQLRISLKGLYSTPALSVGNLAITIKLGGVTLATGTASSLVVGTTNADFDANALITCRTTGVSGTVMTSGNEAYSLGNNIAAARVALNNGTSTSTINTTTDNLLEVTVTWSNNTSGNSVSSLNFSLESLN